jgi:hypothetical protein
MPVGTFSMAPDLDVPGPGSDMTGEAVERLSARLRTARKMNAGRPSGSPEREPVPPYFAGGVLVGTYRRRAHRRAADPEPGA